ncbi:MAG: hypothetical protein AAGC71_10475 [Pseudomonadota bacterium]
MTGRHSSWPVWPLAVATAVIPIVAVTVSATIAMALDLVPRCVPFIDGCTSISATGRYAPASYVFKGVLLPFTGLLALYWILVVAWLERLPDGSKWQAARLCLTLALLSAFAMAVYAVLLGSRGDAYEFMRRFGIYFFFLFTVVAQVLTALRMRVDSTTYRAGTWQLRMAVVMLGLGVLNVVLKTLLDDPDQAENRIEWVFGLLMFVNFAPVIGPLRSQRIRVAMHR